MNFKKLSQMKAYPDPYCVYGYMTICDECIKSSDVPSYVDTKNPIKTPPALGKKQRCEMCNRRMILEANPFSKWYKVSEIQYDKNLRLLSLPRSTQEFSWDCGPHALISILNGASGNSPSKEQISLDAKADKEEGVVPSNFINVLKKNNIKTKMIKSPSLEQIEKYVNKGFPVALIVQAYSENIGDANNLKAGHWVVLNGMDNEDLYFIDPSNASDGITKISKRDFMKRWKNSIKPGQPEERTAIVVGKKIEMEDRDVEHIQEMPVGFNLRSVMLSKKLIYAEVEGGGKIYKKDLGIDIPQTLMDVLQTLQSSGSYGLLVGGAVRDRFLGKEPKDLDVEIYNTNYDNLYNVLKQFDVKGSPDVVGKSFGIIKIKDKEGNEYDFSIPRRESKTGIGHKGFNVEFDPTITPKEAASRRDFTMNALAYNPLTHEVHDYFNGVEDIGNRLLKATSPAFAEDPLRVLRGLQFSGRLGFDLDPETGQMMKSLMSEYSSLAKERISGEWMKAFVKSKHPEKIIQYLIDCGWIDLYPELKGIIGVQQEPEWHPEGTADVHTSYVLQASAKIADEYGLKEDDRAVLLMSALCHDLGKATHTKREVKNGVERWTSPGHEAASVPLAQKFLNDIGIKNDLIKRVLPLVGNHMQHITYDSKSKGGNVRQIAERIFPATVKELELMIRSDMGGRPPLPGGLPPEAEQMVADAKQYGVYESKLKDLIRGQDLIDLFSIPPGPIMKETITFVRGKMLEGRVQTREQALVAAETFLKNKLSFINGNDIMTALGVSKGGPFIEEIKSAAWEEQKSKRINNREEALAWLSNYVAGSNEPETDLEPMAAKKFNLSKYN